MVVEVRGRVRPWRVRGWVVMRASLLPDTAHSRTCDGRSG
jgi:hypothetical protein